MTSFALESHFSSQILLDNLPDICEGDVQLSGNRSQWPAIGTVDEIFHIENGARRTHWMQTQAPQPLYGLDRSLHHQHYFPDNSVDSSL